MIKVRLLCLLIVVLLRSANEQSVPPYYNCGQLDGSINTTKAKVVEALNAKG